MSEAVAVRYFDGRSARPVPARLSVEDGIARLNGESLSLQVELHQLRVSEVMARGPRLVTLPDGSHCEVDDAAAFAALLLPSAALILFGTRTLRRSSLSS